MTVSGEPDWLLDGRVRTRPGSPPCCAGKPFHLCAFIQECPRLRLLDLRSTGAQLPSAEPFGSNCSLSTVCCAGLGDADLQYICAQLEAQAATWPQLQVHCLAVLRIQLQASSCVMHCRCWGWGLRQLKVCQRRGAWLPSSSCAAQCVRCPTWPSCRCAAGAQQAAGTALHEARLHV